MINETSIQFRVYSNYVFVNVRFDIMTQVVVDWVSHELRESFLESFLVEFVIFEDLNYHIQMSLVLIGEESYSIGLIRDLSSNLG